jgi:NADH dehydrogenase FAD-containing subunit
VVALGAVTRTFPIPGLAEHGRGFKDVADAVALRNHLLRSLESFPPKLGEYTHRYLEREGIEIHVETTLTSFDELEAVLSDGTRIPARTLVWAAGVRPSPDLALLGLPLDERGG